MVYTAVGADMGHSADASRAESYRSFGGGRHQGLWFNEAISESDSGLFLIVTLPECGATPGEGETLWFREPVNAYSLLSNTRDAVISPAVIAERRGHLLGRAGHYLYSP